jgi:hypothetical protein
MVYNKYNKSREVIKMYEYEMFNTKTNEVKFLFGRNLKVLMAKAEMNETEWTCVYKEYID